MKFIEEIVVEEFVPTFRSLLAEELHQRGLTQSDVAALLGISQSAVSKYVHGEVGRNDRLANDERVRSHVTRLAEELAAGETTAVQALVETEVLIRELERGGVLAELHAEDVPALREYSGHFAVHDPDSRLREAERVRSSVQRGVRVLENTSGFAALIPAVGTNLVECLPDAASIEDVAAVPGRVLDVKGKATVPAEPEFGVSQHVATVLLAARDAGHDARAALNVAYDDEVLSVLEGRGHVVAPFDAEADLESAISDALARTPGATVLYQSGAMGIEPVVYLLGADAPTVARIARDLV